MLDVINVRPVVVFCLILRNFLKLLRHKIWCIFASVYVHTKMVLAMFFIIF